MLKFLIRRVLLAMAVALCVSMLTFGLLHVATDPAIAIAGEDASAEEIEVLRVAYGFDRPLYVQYADWLSNAVQGDFGKSPYFG